MLVALVLLLVTTLSLWVTLIFPVWVLGVSILILVANYRRAPRRALLAHDLASHRRI